MFDKFFTLNKDETRCVLKAGYGEVIRLTIVGKIEEHPRPDKALYKIEVIYNNVKETTECITVPEDQILSLELKDGSALFVEAYYDDISFHINGHIYKVA